MDKSAAEVARLFNAVAEPGNAGSEVYPGYPGYVVAQGQLRQMTWGFPLRLKGMSPAAKPKPINNTRADKLDSFIWRYSFDQRRCLIPVTAFAENRRGEGQQDPHLVRASQ
jgi:putative SOS response-associated peptidase YedK